MYSLKDFNKEFEKLDLSTIPAKSKYLDDAERGIDGEKKVKDILLKYSDELYQSVVIWNLKHDFTTEIDFICMINGFLVLVETKEWYGTITRIDPTRVQVDYININGKPRQNKRTNPVYSVAGFFKDLRKYLSPNIPGKETQIQRIVVFTRDEVVINGSLAESKTIVCKLDELEEKLIEIKNLKNKNPYILNKDLPSWDYYYNSNDNSWYKAVILNNTITIGKEEVPISGIDSIYFDNNNASILFVDETVIPAVIDKKSLRFNSNNVSEAISMSFIKFDRNLHILQQKETK